ncbi:MAG: hypothetical protein HY898_28025 [Deltaproteobacteria bacterium]|nr:hypothetical protein [Deltaproteobacteria bacterium]
MAERRREALSLRRSLLLPVALLLCALPGCSLRADQSPGCRLDHPEDCDPGWSCRSGVCMRPTTTLTPPDASASGDASDASDGVATADAADEPETSAQQDAAEEFDAGEEPGDDVGSEASGDAAGDATLD